MHFFLTILKKVHLVGGQSSSYFSTREQLRDWGEEQGSDLCWCWICATSKQFVLRLCISLGCLERHGRDSEGAGKASLANVWPLLKRNTAYPSHMPKRFREIIIQSISFFLGALFTLLPCLPTRTGKQCHHRQNNHKITDSQFQVTKHPVRFSHTLRCNLQVQGTQKPTFTNLLMYDLYSMNLHTLVYIILYP